jgi:hypothetical protein
LRVSLIVALTLALSACGTMSKMWPFGKKPKPGPEIVNEVELVNADGTTAGYPQFWQRNTLIIDLTDVSGSGNVAARLREETTWPVRVAVRVRPASVQQIEVRGEERNVMAVSPQGVKPIDLELEPSVFRPTTSAIYISWGPMPVFVDAAPIESAETVAAAPGSTLPPNTVPRLRIVWNCGDCERNDKVIPLILQSYREAASRQGRTVSDAETAEAWIVDFRQRNPANRSLFGIMGGKDRLGLKIRFRGRVYDASDYSANAVFGMNHLCETVGKETFSQIRTSMK